MIDRTHALPVTRQARALGISCGSVDYLPHPTSLSDLAVMRRLDELHMDFPFADSLSCETCLPPTASMSSACMCRR